MSLSPNIADHDSSILTFSYADEQSKGITHPEDGTPLINTAYFLVATAPNGLRWRRYMGLSSWKVDILTDEDGCMFPLVYEVHTNIKGEECNGDELNRYITKLEELLNKNDAPKLNFQYWSFADPCYGSEAYERYNMEEVQIQAEKQLGSEEAMFS